MTQPVVSSNSYVCNRSSPPKEFLTHFLVAKIKLESIFCTKPVICPRLCPLAFSSNPTANQIAVVCVTAAPCKIKIIKSFAHISADWIVCVDAFDSQIQLWQARKV